MKTSIYKGKNFQKFAKSNNIPDQDLLDAVREIEAGLIDAELGGHVIKKRIKGRSKGKRGGFRTILLFREGKRIIFAHGYGKDEKANITKAEKDGFKELADILLGLKKSEFDALVASGEFTEIKR